MRPTTAASLVARCLPDDAAEQLVEAVTPKVKPLLRRAGPEVRDRLLSEWRALASDIRVPASLRARLLREAERRLHAGESTATIIRALDALVEPVFARAMKRLVEKHLPAFAARAQDELDLHREASALHRRVLKNWRYAHEDAGAIIADECALATALLLYWLCAPHYYRRYAHRREAADHERRTWDVLRAIERSVRRGEYPHASIAFDPRKGPHGDLTKDRYKALPRRTDIPEEMWIVTTPTGIEPLPRRRTRPR